MIPLRHQLQQPLSPEFQDLPTAYLRADDLADAAESTLLTMPSEVQKHFLREASAGHHPPEMPEALRMLVESMRITVPPPEAGELLFRGGLWSAQSLAAGALMVAFASPAGNKPLVKSGMFTEDAGPRLMRTARYVIGVCTPGGLEPGAPGFRETLHVRLMHSRVRRKLRSGWPIQEWGLPICQYDMAGTPLLFSVLMIEGLQKLGLEIPEAEADRYCLLWARAGQMMGVEPGLCREKFEKGRELLAALRMGEGTPDEDGRQLAKALAEAGGAWTSPLLRHTLGPIRGPLTASVCRWTMGDDFANSLALPKGPTDALLPVVKSLTAAQNRLDRHSHGRALSLRAGRHTWKLLLEGYQPGVIPEQGKHSE